MMHTIELLLWPPDQIVRRAWAQLTSYPATVLLTYARSLAAWPA